MTTHATNCAMHPDFDGVPIVRKCTCKASEQPLPTINTGPCIQDMVIADIEARKVVGIQRYGTVLQPHNGRDALRDAYEEALDLCQYLKQVIVERDGR